MVQTRSMRKRQASRRKSYDRRLKKSPCRGKGRATCRRTTGCKYTKGKKRTFCRKGRNAKRMRGGNGQPHKIAFSNYPDGDIKEGIASDLL